MLESLRRWWSGRPALGAWAEVKAWSDARGWSFKTSREQDGFVIDPAPSASWRLEWGPSHRRYLGGHELRLRGEAGIDPAAFAVVMPRALLEALERELFDAFTEGVQTRVDDALPEEMRWLAMAPRLHGSELGELREWVAAVGNTGPWLRTWLTGPTGASLLAALTAQGKGAVVPLALQNGQIVLRAGLTKPDPARIAEMLTLFEVALSEARRLADVPFEAAPAGG